MSAEEWRPIPLAPGYEASSLGRVRSFRRGAPPNGRILSQLLDRLGYPTVKVNHGGKWRWRLVHQLMMEAFVGPRPEWAQGVRHLNDVKTDNRIENLTYGTASENVFDQVRHGLHAMARRSSCKHGHPFEPANTSYRKNGTRLCRTCARLRSQRRRALARAA